MSLFENMSFLNEGEQVEKYKARKAEEKEEAEKKEKERDERRKYWGGYKYGPDYRAANPDIDKHELQKRTEEDYKRDHATAELMTRYGDDRLLAKTGLSDKDIKKFNKIINSEESIPKKISKLDKFEKHHKNELDEYDHQRRYIYDGINRHIRRHPDQYKESGIFESVQFIDE